MRLALVLLLALAAACSDDDRCSAGTEPADGTCTACPEGTFSADGDACRAWSECGPGSEPAGEPSAERDRTCSACDEGTFSAGGNATCIAWSSCAPGSGASNEPSATENRVCVACGAGTFSTGGASACVAWTPCEAGTEPSNAPNASTDRECSACASGTFSPGGTTACAAWSDCVPGTEPTTMPTASTDRACGSCAAGSYSDATNTACQPWTECEAGTFVGIDGTATQDQDCQACNPGTYTDASNQPICAAWTSCGDKVVEASGTADSDRQCCADDRVGSDCSYDVSAWALVYDLSIPTGGAWDVYEDVPYAVDASDVTASSFDKVAYLLEIDDTYVWAEFDDVTGGVPEELGVPVDWVYDTAVSNLTLRSNSGNVVEVDDQAGSIEFWHFNYAPGSTGAYDYDDDIGPLADGFGSMQVHRGTRTELAFNRWSISSGNDIGIGPRTEAPFDYTNLINAGRSSRRRLRVFVLPGVD